jgi:uncharacterized membrane-anchored protein YhcB (DUF1043 family)
MENKTANYFKYAIGEIVLVVIGILIALSINTWNENQKSKNEAQFQLSKLKDNLTSDNEQIKNVIATDARYIKHLTLCVRVLSNEVEMSIEEFTKNFQLMYNTLSFNPTQSTFESLISSGKIELIKNQSLLDDLFSYYNAKNYTAWDSSIKDYTRNIFGPYLINFDHVPNPTDESEGSDFTHFNISKFAVPRKTIDDYKNNLFIINALRQKILLFEGQKMQYLDLQKEIDSLIERINVELKQ